MSSLHPIDDFFKRKLEQLDGQPPMHIWDQINQTRKKHKPFALWLNLNRWPVMAASVAILALVMSAVFFFNDDEQLSFFPIPETNNLYASQKEDVPLKPIENKSIGEHSQAPIFKNSSTKAKPTILASVLPKLDSKISKKVTSTEQADVSLLSKFLVDIKPNSTVGQVSQMEALQQLSSSIKPLQTANRKNIFPKDPECARFNRGQWAVYLDLMASPDIAFRELSSKQTEYAEYAATRRQTESPLFTMSAGARLSVVSGFGLAIRSGLSYSQINEKFEFIQQGDEQVKIIDIYQNGQWVGTDTIVEIGIRRKITYNRYRTLDLPLLLGYEVNYKNFVFTLNAGAYINLMFNQKGDFLSPQNLEPVSFSSNDPNAFPAFKNKLGVGWYGSVGILYRLNPKLMLLAEPNFKMYPKPITRDQYILDQRYLTAGLSLGIRHQF